MTPFELDLCSEAWATAFSCSSLKRSCWLVTEIEHLHGEPHHTRLRQCCTLPLTRSLTHDHNTDGVPPTTQLQEGGPFKTWRRRFFVLSTAVEGEDATHVLRYYKKRNDANPTTRPTGVVFITKGVTKVNIVQRGRRKCIQLTTPASRRDFYVAPERDFARWEHALTDFKPPPNSALLRRNTIGKRPKPAAPTLDEDAGGVPATAARELVEVTADTAMSVHHICTVLRPLCLEKLEHSMPGNAADAKIAVFKHLSNQSIPDCPVNPLSANAHTQSRTN